MTTIHKVSVAIVGMALLIGVNGLAVKPAHGQEVSTDDSSAVQDSDSDGPAVADGESPDALPISVAGQWQGTISDDKLGAADFTITFSQKRRKLKGGWTADFNSEPEFLGDFRGLATSERVNFHLLSGQFDRKSCRLIFRSVTANGGQIQGDYKWVDCGKQFRGDKGGSIDITPVEP